MEQNLNDAGILALFRERKEEAITAAKEKYGKTCRSIIRNIVPDDADVEECENDTYLRLWDTIPPASPDSLFGYTAKIARHIALDRYRSTHTAKRGRGAVCLPAEELTELLAGGTDPETELQCREMQRSINGFLRELPDDKRDIFLMRYWFGDSLQDISRSTGYTVGKIKMILQRTKEKLKEHLQEGGFIG